MERFLCHDVWYNGLYTLTAHWEVLDDEWGAGENISVVTLDPQGGTVTPDELYVVVGEQAEELPTPVRDGYKFTGWYDEYGFLFTNETIIYDNITLYAEWEKADSGWRKDSRLRSQAAPAFYTFSFFVVTGFLESIVPPMHGRV